jgi:hypothetical protein
MFFLSPSIFSRPEGITHISGQTGLEASLLARAAS